MIEVQCTSCHTRYRIDEQVLPEGLPTFKCSRCGHVFSFEPRKSRLNAQSEKEVSRPEASAEADAGSSARVGRQPEAPESAANPLDRAARNEPASCAQELPASHGPSVSAQSSFGPAASNIQSESSKNQDASKPNQQSGGASDLTADPSPDAAGGEPSGTAQALPRPEIAAEKARRFYSRLFTGKDPDAVSGENLSFDFADEEPGHDQTRLIRRGRRTTSPPPSRREIPRWQVGDDESTPSIESTERGIFEKSTDSDHYRDEKLYTDERLSSSARRRARAGQRGSEFTDDHGFIDEEAAPIYNRARPRIHSSRFFVLLILLIGIGFGAMTLLIHTAPSASSAVLGYLPLVGDRFALSTTPAKLVALREVNAAYQEGKTRPPTLIITGVAENVGTAPLRAVQVTAVLRDAQRRLVGSQAVYCGNTISPSIVGQMTPHEIEFLQKLEPPKTFSLEPSGTCRFVAVFLNPPGAAHAYDVSVSQALPGTAVTDEPGS